MIGPIDFCVSFIGENSGLLARLFFGTLKRHCNIDNLSLHLVCKQVSSDVWAEVVESATRLSIPTHTYELDTGWRPYDGGVGEFYSNCSDFEQAYNDAADTAVWCVDNCGVADWCILSHFDVVWRDDIVTWLRTNQEKYQVAMVGSHCPIMLLNRVAYRSVGVPFDVVGHDDVGVRLASALRAVLFPPQPDMEWCFHHMGGGGGYHTREEFQSMRDRTTKLISDLEL